MDMVTVSEIDSVSEAKANPTTKVLLDCTNKDVTCTSRNEEVTVDLLAKVLCQLMDHPIYFCTCGTLEL